MEECNIWLISIYKSFLISYKPGTVFSLRFPNLHFNVYKNLAIFFNSVILSQLIIFCVLFLQLHIDPTLYRLVYFTNNNNKIEKRTTNMCIIDYKQV